VTVSEVEVPFASAVAGKRGRSNDYTGKWTETVAISENGPSDPDYFRLARDSGGTPKPEVDKKT